MPLWFGHGKRLKLVEGKIDTVSTQVGTIDGKIDQILNEFEQEDTQPNGTVNEAPETPSMTRATTDSYRNKLNAIEQEILNCNDADRLPELFAMEKDIRKWYNARQKARLYKLNPPSHTGGRPRETYENNGDMGDERIGEVAQEIGISPEGKLDPGKLYHTLNGLIQKNKTAANMIAKMAGIENLDEAMKMFGQVISDPAKTAELGTLVGSGLTGVVKGAIDKFGAMKPPPTQGPQQGPAQQPSNPAGPMRTSDGFPLFAVGGKMVDPRNPYPVAG